MQMWRTLGLAAVVFIACAQQQSAKRAEKPKPAVLGDTFPAGEPLGMQRTEAEDVAGEDVKTFLGESAAGIAACGALEASRTRYAFDGDQELVALLVVFGSADASRCGYDVARPDTLERVDIRGALADRREVKGLLGDHRLLVMLKGRRMVRIFLPTAGAGPTRARSLAQTLADTLPADGESLLIPLLPGADLVPGSARVVAKGPIAGMEGLVGTANYACGEAEAVGFVSLQADAAAAKALREGYQRHALEDFMTVNPLTIRDVPVVSVVSVDTHKETMLMHHGRLVMGVSEMPRRRDCIPVIESMAALRELSPPDAGVPAPQSDGGALP